MSTLLLRLAAPMQSWGAEAKFDRRTTQRAPTKSGVTGLIAAAMGRKRNQSIADLSMLRFGVRTDREGVLLRDYHTAKSQRSAYVTNRYYLSDAIFLVGVEGDDALLRQIDAALCMPAFPLFLGRRSCPPEGRISLGIREGMTLEQALSNEPVLTSRARSQPEETSRLRIMIETTDGQDRAYFLRDMPISYDQAHRRFGFRRVYEYNVPHCESALPDQRTEHDPMAELEG